LAGFSRDKQPDYRGNQQADDDQLARRGAHRSRGVRMVRMPGNGLKVAVRARLS
jgi:hypothetical protein